MNISRRSFLKGMAMGGAMAATGCKTFFEPVIDENMTAFISDLHVSAFNPGVKHCGEFLRQRVAEILAGNRLPKRVVIFGDIAYLYGKKADYEMARPILQPFRDLGIEIVYGLGNHDRRVPFYEVFPEECGKTLVEGRHVVKADCGSFDLLMLDSLDEPATDDRWISPGNLGEVQGEWLKTELPKWQKPVLLCAHHPLCELNVGRESLLDAMAKNCQAFGFVHGHNHQWRKGFADSWNGMKLVRSLCLPSTGCWGDIGYAMMHATGSGCRINLTQVDAFFPGPVEASKREANWDKLIEENQGQYCEFAFRKPVV